MDDQEGAARAVMLAKFRALERDVPVWTNTLRRSMPSSVYSDVDRDTRATGLDLRLGRGRVRVLS